MHNRRTQLRNVIIASLIAFSVGFAGWMANTDLESSASAAIATAVGLLVAVASLVIAVIQAFPAEAKPKHPGELACRLAKDVRAQWVDEAEARWLRDELEKTPVLPMTWAITDRNVGDHAGRQLLAPGGRLDGRFDEAAASLAAVYRGIDSQRLIMLGEPGAGKTVLAMLLTVGLLPESRFQDGAPNPSSENPVPVLLSASSWDPVSEALDDWIIRSLALSYFGDEPEAPRALLKAGMLVPIIDGLDEIPEAARRSAVHALSRAVAHGRPLVVTCRSVEYEDTIKGGAPVLHRAPVIEITPVTAADTIDYLQAANTSECAVWDKVYSELRQVGEPGPLAAALCTPLMITMASTVYGGVDGDPSPLLDQGEITCRHDVEDHLLDRVVAAEFRDESRRPWQPPVNPSPWNAAQVEGWLTFLAEYLHRHRERDLAWWRMSERLLPRWATPVIALLAGAIVMLLVIAYTAIVEVWYPSEFFSSKDTVMESALVGFYFAVLATLILYAVPGRPPGRSPTSFRGSLPRLRRGFTVGLLVTSIPATPVLVGWAIGLTIFRGWTFSGSRDFITGLAVIVGSGALLSLAIAADALLSAPSELSGKPSPARFLRDDRRSSLIGAGAAAAVVAAGGVPIVLAALILGTNGGTALLRWLSGAPEPDGRPPSVVGSDFFTAPQIVQWCGFGVLFPGLVIGLLVLLTHAWPRYVAVRAVLTLRRQLPWNLPRFLAYARTRGVLREVGGMHQFRHVRLQERLAGRPAEPAPVTALARRRRLHVIAAVGTAVLAIGATVAVLQQPASARSIAFDLSPVSTKGNVSALNRDGTVMAVGNASTINVWDLDLTDATGRHRAPISLPKQSRRIHAVAVSPDGELVAVSVENNNYYRSGVKAPDTVYLLTRQGSVHAQWNFPYPILHLSFGTSPSRLAGVSVAGEIQIMIDGNKKPEYLPATGNRCCNPDIRVSMIDDFSVALGFPKTVEVYGNTGLPRLTRTGHTKPITAIGVSTDGSVIVTGSRSATLRFHPVGAMEESLHVTSGHLRSIGAIAVRDPDARVVVAADATGAELWNVT